MLHIGIIGSGFGVRGLLPAFESIPGSSVVAVCAKEMVPTKGKGQSITIYADWQHLLEHEGLDAIAIAVTPQAQYIIAKAAIAKGIHVFAEKPLAATHAQAVELLALAKKKRVTHGIDFLFTEIPEWKKAKQIIDSGRLGKLRHLAVNWDWMSGDLQHGRSTWKTDVREGGGALSFYFSHGLHYLEHFAGTITDVKRAFSYSPRSRNGAETGLDMVLAFKGGVTGYAHVSCASAGRTRHQLVFECEEGVLVLENKDAVVDAFTLTMHTTQGERQVPVKKELNRRGEDERVKIVRILARRFVDACRKKIQTNPSFVEGVRVQALIERIRA